MGGGRKDGRYVIADESLHIGRWLRFSSLLFRLAKNLWQRRMAIRHAATGQNNRRASDHVDPSEDETHSGYHERGVGDLRGRVRLLHDTAERSQFISLQS